jgi:hypothetical protein
LRIQAIEACCYSKVNRKEKEEAILARLQLTKGQVSELREKCETLKPQSGNRENLICRECSESIEVDQVALKSSLGEIEAYYQRPP